MEENMAQILSMKDRVKLKLAKVTFILKPLNVMEQNEIMSHKKVEAGETVDDILMQAFAHLKFALKGIEGVKTASGDDYKLEFDGDYLSDDCASEIFTLELGAEFYHAAQYLKSNSIHNKLTYIGTKKPLKGVKLEIMPQGGAKM